MKAKSFGKKNLSSLNIFCFKQKKLIPAGGGVDAGIGSGPSVDDGITAVHYAALICDAEGPQPI